MNYSQDTRPRLTYSLRALRGFGYGLRQKTMVGSIRADEALNPRLDEILKAVEDYSTNNYYKPGQPLDTANTAIAKLFRLYLLAHQYAKIPVFEELKLRPTDQAQGLDNPSLSRANIYQVALPYWDLNASRDVISWIATTAQVHQGTPDIQSLLNRIGRHGLHGTNAYPFLKAAWQQRAHYSQVAGRTMQLGLGAQSRWMNSSLTDRTPGIAVSIARNKHTTNQLLGRLGFPVPRQVVVTSLEQASHAAAQLDCPVAIKPQDQDQGRGVSVGLSNQDDIEIAYKLAAQYSSSVIVEQTCTGIDYRITVFEGKVVKVMQRTPLTVRGDGHSSITSLLKQAEELSLKEQGPALQQSNPYLVDNEILQTIQHQGYGLNDTPPKGLDVPLRRKANLSTGGTQTLITIATIHPDNIHLAVSATKLLRLDFCGIDLIMPDIRKSWLDVGGHIIELNAQPQLGVRYAPEVYAEIVDQMLIGHTPSVQLVLDLTTHDSPTAITAKHPTVQGLTAGLMPPVVVASSTHLWKDSQLIQSNQQAPGATIQAALHEPTAHSLIFIMGVQELLDHGLPTHQIKTIHCMSEATMHPAILAQQLKQIQAIAPNTSLHLVRP